jgi:hypothetical protein
VVVASVSPFSSSDDDDSSLLLSSLAPTSTFPSRFSSLKRKLKRTPIQ